MATKEEQNQANFDALCAAVPKLPAVLANQVFNEARFARKGGLGGETTLGGEVAWLAYNFADVKATLLAQIKGLAGALAAVAGGEDFDEEKLLAGVQAAAAAGAREILESLEVTGSVTDLKLSVSDDQEGGVQA